MVSVTSSLVLVVSFICAVSCQDYNSGSYNGFEQAQAPSSSSSGTISSRPGSVLSAMINDPDLSTLIKLLLGITNSANELKKATSFDPTSLASQPSEIIRIVKNHVVVGQAYSGNQLKNGVVLTSALGNKLRVETGYLYGTYIKGEKNRVRVDLANNLVGRSYVQKVDGIIIPK